MANPPVKTFSPEEARIKMLESKCTMLYERMNRLYKMAGKISSFESRGNEKFLGESETIDDMQRKFESFVDEKNELILTNIPGSEPDFQLLSNFDDLFVMVKRVRNKIDSNSKKDVNSACSKSIIRLPPIDLPTFNGTANSWPIFYETFKSNIHENSQLSDSQRMQYLVGKLTHSAQSILAGVVPSAETYNIIWDSLVKKYQDNRVLGTHYLNNIFELKPCSNSVTSLNYFIEKYSASISALKQLNIEDLSDFIFLHCALKKMDSQIIQYFEMQFDMRTEIPSYKDLISFIQNYIKVLERSTNKHTNIASRATGQPQSSKSFVSNTPLTTSNVKQCDGSSVCNLCSNTHAQNLYNCSEFKKLLVSQRFEYIKNNKGCLNCLSLSHTVSHCKSKRYCNVCAKRHHTFLHFDKNYANLNSSTPSSSNAMPTLVPSGSLPVPLYQQQPLPTQQPLPPLHDIAQTSTHLISNNTTVSHVAHRAAKEDNSAQSSALVHNGNNNNFTILLATAQAFAKLYKSNVRRVVRCLIDNGSQNNLITIDCCKTLNLPIVPLNNAHIKGVGLLSRPIHGYVYINIESRVDPNCKYYIYALVIDCITDQLPAQFVATCNLSHLNNIPLADDSWNHPGSIDIVLGAQLFPYIYLGNRIESDFNFPPAVLTTFGYVLMGDYPCESHSRYDISPFSALALNDIDSTLRRFWESEEIPCKRFLSPEETECENLFTASLGRSKEGRYCVSLPFSKDPSELGHSRSIAYRRLLALERRFKILPKIRDSYNDVINDYIQKDFLSEVPATEASDNGYFISHHAVLRPDKPAPRIVLDASAKTHTGLSLNCVLHAGPNLQADLFLLLIGFRLFPVAVTADIKAMYMQIEVSPCHRKFLRILFRFNEKETIHTFQFNRLAFGLKSSPFLAMRIVRQLASDYRECYPEAAEVAESHLYMDDLVYSVADESHASKISRELIALFKLGCFDLVKWASNSSSLLAELPASHRAPINFSGDEHNYCKVLGVSWDPAQDDFFFITSQGDEKYTKRSILSFVARLYDVLGLVSPVILYAKLLIKDLWLSNIDWDSTPSDTIAKRFRALRQELPLLDTLKIPRHIGAFANCAINLVAFCDASLNAYGAAIYLHVTGPSDASTVRLLCSKSKVSPTKIVTLARLELNSCVLAAKLVKTVYDSYNARIKIAGTYVCSDSTIALSWVHSSPHRWSIYVSNRVAQCQEHLAPHHFFHVAGIDNPSDCLSRGMLPKQLISHDLWWNGPSWLSCLPSEWPIKPFSPTETNNIPEAKVSVLTATTTVSENSVLCDLARRISTWNKLLRIIVMIISFTKRHYKLTYIDKLRLAEKMLIKAVQKLYFIDDINRIQNGKLPSKKLRNLSVFLDGEGILRLGGRLSRSDLPFEAKHPALLPKRDHVVDLIIQHSHLVNCHAGPSLLISLLRQKYWILDARTVIRSKIRECNQCFRVKPSHPNPIMADLPSYRVLEAKAFVHTGVDYCGPIKITLARRRGHQSIKAYICVFVCLTTKAVHIELVTDLTSDTFLGAFKRFISRRGPVSFIYSDNGTNFVGARAQLKEVQRYTDEKRIEWKMIPPRSPHFGGMWESSVKSLKTHLYRVIGSQILTYEEMQTVLVQIECILNSRPLCVLTSDPHPEVLTPSHFLMSSPLQHLPANDIKETDSLRNRKNLLDHMVQSYWKKWRLEYLHTLQVRQKWCTPDNPVNVGKVVLVEQEDVPPLRWPLGVITQVYPGSDNVVRVASVKTASGIYKRPVVKLYPLPTQ